MPFPEGAHVLLGSAMECSFDVELKVEMTGSAPPWFLYRRQEMVGKRTKLESAANLHPGSSAPTLRKKFKKNTRKIQKIPSFFVVVDNLMREVRPKNELI